MLWVTPEEGEAREVARLMASEGLWPRLRYQGPRGLLPARWIVVAVIEDLARERRLQQRCAGLLPKDWKG